MRFVLDAEQLSFAETLRELLSKADVPRTVRAWAAGEHGPGRELWRSLGRTGVFAFTIGEEHGGAGVLPVELVTAMIELGRRAVPGPVVETIAASVLLRDPGRLAAIAEGSLMATLACPPSTPYALDADAADLVLTLDDEVPGNLLHTAEPTGMRRSLDPARRLFDWQRGDLVESEPPTADAYNVAVLACAAQVLGLGRHLLAATVDYAKTREQFGRPIGEFQAVKHHLADALTGLEFAQPLVYGAALSYGTPGSEVGRDVSAAKVAASEAAYAAAKVALQVHGAIGYTDEYDLSLWIRKARALLSAWGTPAEHRERVMAALPHTP